METYKIPIIQIDDVYNGTSTNHKLRISDILRIKGKGINNPDSWKKGDFYCVLKLIIPTSLTREQKRILSELEDTDLEDSSEFRKFEKLNK